jgi:hypothetical protein
MFYPGSGSEKIFIPDPDPDPKSYVKGGSKTKHTFFLLLMVSGVRVPQFHKDNKDSEDNVRKFHQKSGRIRFYGVKKA